MAFHMFTFSGLILSQHLGIHLCGIGTLNGQGHFASITHIQPQPERWRQHRLSFGEKRMGVFVAYFYQLRDLDDGRFCQEI